MKKIVLIIPIFITVIQAQQLRFENLGTNEGLSQSQVNCVLLDKKGFLWFGTQDGLNKYDGYSFTIFRNEPGNSNSISNNNVLELAEYDGKIWIGTHGGGLDVLNPTTGKFCHYNLSSDSISLFQHNIVSAIFFDSFGKLWLGTEGNGLLNLDYKKNKLISYCPKKGDNYSISSNIVSSIVEDKNGYLWVGTEKGLDKFDRKSGKFEKYFSKKKLKDGLSDDEINFLFLDQNEILWIATEKGGLNKFDLSTKKFSSFQNVRNNLNSITSNSVTTIFEDDKNCLWIGTNSGLNIFDRKTGKFSVFRHEIGNHNSISNDHILCMLKDNSGVLWIGTIEGGINKLSPSANRFQSVQHISGKQNGLSNNSIWSFCQDKDGILWIGTEKDGLNAYDRKNNSFNYYKHNPLNNNSLSFNYITALFVDDENKIWIGTYGNGLDIFDKKSGKFFHFKPDKKNNFSISGDRIGCIYQDKSGDIWVGTTDGLNLFDKKNHRFIHYLNNPSDPTTISNDNVLSIFEDSEGTLWLGTYGGGLNKFDKKSGKSERFLHNVKDPATISDNTVMTICEDRNGFLWIGTDIGLNKFDKKTKKFKRFSLKDGLPNHIIYGILPDENDNLWICTNNGISKYNLYKNTFTNYTVNNGLQSNEFNQGATYKNPQGEMFFGGINGYNSFFPNSIVDNVHIPSVVITKVKIWNDVVSPDRYSSDNELTVSYSENFLSFEFSSLDFSDPKMNQFKYKMFGFDKYWIGPDHQRFASYTNLNPGTYYFNVIASNNDGVWNKKGATLKIIVLPPYWMTWWFRILVGGLFIVILVFLYNIRVSRLLEVERLRTRIASDLHDEVGASLTKITTNAGIAVYEKSVEAIKPKLEKIETTAREVVSIMNDIIWSIDSRNDTIQDLLDRMRDFAFNLLGDKNIEIEFKLDEFDQKKKISVDIRQNIFLIFKEAINNAAKYSETSQINVQLHNRLGMFEMKIVDNGKGLPEKIHYGNGIRNMKMRAERIKASLEFLNENGLTIILTRKEI